MASYPGATAVASSFSFVAVVPKPPADQTVGFVSLPSLWPTLGPDYGAFAFHLTPGGDDHGIAILDIESQQPLIITVAELSGIRTSFSQMIFGLSGK